MFDRFGLLPASLRAEYEAQDAEVRVAETIQFLDKALKGKDPALGLVRVKEDIPEWDLPMGAVPGYWHIRNAAPGFIPVYMPIKGPKGEFRLPASDVLEMADRMDLRKPEVFREVIERGRRQKEEKEKAKALEDEQRRDEMAADFKAARRVIGEGRYSDGRLKPSKWGKQ